MKVEVPAQFNHKSAVFHDAIGVNVMAEDVCLPAALIKKEALNSNLEWMQRYANQAGVLLAPHGKTTMSPQLFAMQKAAGAWGVGVGTVYQASIAIKAGMQNIIMANQLIGQANMRAMAMLKRHHPEVSIYCCVDSLDNAKVLSDFFTQEKMTMDVLLELGVAGKRCGCRTRQQAEVLARSLHSLEGLRFAGIEFYEGVIHSDNEQQEIKIFVEGVLDFTHWVLAENLLEAGDQLLTGSGTAWYDVVSHALNGADLPETLYKVIRPGCYITHDIGVYDKAQRKLRKRDGLACSIGGDLVSALELAAYVQSVPEPGLAIIGFGKRDASFDEGLPQVTGHYRNGESLANSLEDIITVGIMDQHAMIRFSHAEDVKVGDIMVFGISHPCLTFDKWQHIYLVDDDYNVMDAIETFF